MFSTRPTFLKEGGQSAVYCIDNYCGFSNILPIRNGEVKPLEISRIDELGKQTRNMFVKRFDINCINYN